MSMTEVHAFQRSQMPREWWAIYTRHQHEKTVAENFSAHGLEVFLPLYKAIRQWEGSAEAVISASVSPLRVLAW